jgi:quinol monooxygenase YgiN
VAPFAQQTRLRAATGKAEALFEKFAEAARIQHKNPACRLMLAGISAAEPDVVYLVEVWSSEETWEAARSSEEIARWSDGMAGLVAEPPRSVRLDRVAGKGV